MTNTIQDTITSLLPGDATHNVSVNVADGLVTCTVPAGNSQAQMAVNQILGSMIRDRDLAGGKVGAVTRRPDSDCTAYSVKIADMHKSFQEICGVSVPGVAVGKPS